MPFELFLDDSGKPEKNDKGGVAFVDTATSAKTFLNVNELSDSIRAKNGEAATHRREKEELAKKLEVFKDLDPEAARKALETVSALDAGKLIEAGKVEEVKKAAAAEYAQRVESLNKALETAKAEAQAGLSAKDTVIEDLLIGNGITGSPFLREQTVLPPEVAMPFLKPHFKVEYDDGKPVVRPYDNQGKVIFSPSNPGNPATVDEAIQFIIGSHPQKDSLLKNPAPDGGSGMKQGGGAPAAGKISMESAANLSPAEYTAARKAGRI